MKRVKQILAGSEKQYGKGVISLGGAAHYVERIPTGIFPFDLATGGGFPKGKVSIVFGPESSAKTTLLLKTIAEFQRTHPNEYAAFVDAEVALDLNWAKKLGVDMNRLVHIIPDYAEQAIDITTELLYASDVGIVGVDSIAALTSSVELEQSAETQAVGRSGLNAGKLYRRATIALGRARRGNRYPALICLNQVRYKIGVMHGDPETQPGGKPFMFAAALMVRLYGKDIVDKKIHPTLPWCKEIQGVIRKQKIGVVARNFKFKLPIINMEDKKVRLGQVEAFNTVTHYLGLLGHFEKLKKGYRVFDDTYSTLIELRQTLLEDPDFKRQVEQVIIDEMVERAGLLEGSENAPES